MEKTKADYFFVDDSFLDFVVHNLVTKNNFVRDLGGKKFKMELIIALYIFHHVHIFLFMQLFYSSWK